MWRYDPPQVLGVAALSAALLSPRLRQAAAPWSEPTAVPGSSGQSAGAPNVLVTNTRGSAIAFNAPGSFPGAPLLRTRRRRRRPRSGPAPSTSTPRSAPSPAADRIIYAGSDGERRVNVAIAPGPGSEWRVQKRGPSDRRRARRDRGRAEAHRRRVQHLRRRRHRLGLRRPAVRRRARPGATERISGRGHIRSVAVAVNAAGDVLAAWDRSGTVESRMYSGRSHRWAAVKTLGKVTAAMHMSAAIGADRRAIVAWVDQPINEGGTNKAATFSVTARTATRGFLAAKQVDVYPDLTIVGGTAVRAAYTSDGRGIVAWTGRSAVRAALVNGRSIGAPQDLAPAGADESPERPRPLRPRRLAGRAGDRDDGRRRRHDPQPGARRAAGRRRDGLRADRDGVRRAAVPAPAVGRVRPPRRPVRGRLAGPAAGRVPNRVEVSQRPAP